MECYSELYCFWLPHSGYRYLGNPVELVQIQPRANTLDLDCKHHGDHPADRIEITFFTGVFNDEHGMGRHKLFGGAIAENHSKWTANNFEQFS